jgi:predicted nucleotidyltransferase
MLTPDLELARRFIAAHSPPGEVLLCGVTGSHLYGFPSPDSDLDLKGAHLAPTVEFLGLHSPPETFDRLEPFQGTECDYTSHEAGKALRLLLRGNGNMLERILSPIQLFDGEPLAELSQLARGAISKRCAPHYAGFFRGMCREHERSRPPAVKTLLYAYRVALTGTHLMKTGELVANLYDLAPEYGCPDVLELISRKRAGPERGTLDDGEDTIHRTRWPVLAQALEQAVESSALPEEPRNRSECEAWLVQARRSRL